MRVILILYFKGSLVDPRLRASNEHILIVRVPRAGGRPGCPSHPSQAARSASTGDQQPPFPPLLREQGISTGVVRNAGPVWMVRELAVAGLAGAFGDLLAEAGFFETDFGFFEFGR